MERYHRGRLCQDKMKILKTYRTFIRSYLLSLTVILTVALGGCVADEVGGVYIVSDEPESMYPVGRLRHQRTGLRCRLITGKGAGMLSP